MITNEIKVVLNIDTRDLPENRTEEYLTVYSQTARCVAMAADGGWWPSVVVSGESNESTLAAVLAEKLDTDLVAWIDDDNLANGGKWTFFPKECRKFGVQLRDESL